MSELKNLIDKREFVRAEEKELTQLIVAERAREAEARQQNKLAETVPYEKHLQLKKDYDQLRTMNAVLAKASGNTYKKVGEMLGVSADRARQIVDKGKRRLQGLNQET